MYGSLFSWSREHWFVKICEWSHRLLNQKHWVSIHFWQVIPKPKNSNRIPFISFVGDVFPKSSIFLRDFEVFSLSSWLNWLQDSSGFLSVKWQPWHLEEVGGIHLWGFTGAPFIKWTANQPRKRMSFPTAATTVWLKLSTDCLYKKVKQRSFARSLGASGYLARAEDWKILNLAVAAGPSKDDKDKKMSYRLSSFLMCHVGHSYIFLSCLRFCQLPQNIESKMKPTNPNAHTSVTDTDVQKHLAQQGLSFKCKVLNVKCKM